MYFPFMAYVELYCKTSCVKLYERFVYFGQKTLK